MRYEYSLGNIGHKGRAAQKEHNTSVLVHQINVAETKRCASKGGVVQFWRWVSNSKNKYICLALRLFFPGRLIHRVKRWDPSMQNLQKKSKDMLWQMMELGILTEREQPEWTYFCHALWGITNRR